MRTRAFMCVLSCLLAAITCASWAAQVEDPANKLGIFLGKWQTEGRFTGSDNKVDSALECRWSPQGSYLVCEQRVHLGGSEHRQLTIYSYNAADKDYAYTTLGDPGARPTNGRVEIKGNVWTYSASFEANGKVTHIRTINEFTDPRTEVFKVEFSDDGGATWKTTMQGSAHKTGD